jgi:DNA invertase Pin-like site-specific DNA recombinase
MSTAIYGRVSTERQILAQTIDQQIKRLTAYVQAQGKTLVQRISSVMMGIVAPRSADQDSTACGTGAKRARSTRY